MQACGSTPYTSFARDIASAADAVVQGIEHVKAAPGFYDSYHIWIAEVNDGTSLTANRGRILPSNEACT
jgi:hypothetical protein